MLNSKFDHLRLAACHDDSELTLGARVPRKDECEVVEPDPICAFETGKHEPAPEVLKRASDMDADKYAHTIKGDIYVAMWAPFRRYMASRGQANYTIVDDLIDSFTETNEILEDLPWQEVAAGASMTYTATAWSPDAPALELLGLSAGGVAIHKLTEQMRKEIETRYLTNSFVDIEARIPITHLTPPNRRWFSFGDFTPEGAEFLATATEVAEQAKEKDDDKAYQDAVNYWVNLPFRTKNKIYAACFTDSLSRTPEQRKRFIWEIEQLKKLPEGFTPWFGDENSAEFKELDTSPKTVQVALPSGAVTYGTACHFWWGRNFEHNTTHIVGWRYL